MPAAAVSTPVFAVSETVQRLIKNFARISDSVLLHEGTQQRIVDSNKTVFAIAEFPEAWPREQGIYNLQSFLGELSLYENPVLDFKDDYVVISAGKSPQRRTFYRYADPSIIIETPDKQFPRANPAVEFILTEYDLTQLKKHGSLLKLETINIIVKDGAVQLSAARAKDASAHGYKADIAKGDITVHDTKFKRTIPFKVEHLGFLLDGSYKVALSDWHYGYFTNTVVPVSYYVTEQTKD